MKTAIGLFIAHLPLAAVAALLVEESAMFTSSRWFLPLLFIPGLAALMCSLLWDASSHPICRG